MESIVVERITGTVTPVGAITFSSESRDVMGIKLDALTGSTVPWMLFDT